jgi:hypothetical protein
MSANLEQAKPADSNNSIKIVFLAVNLFCFIVFSALALKLHWELRSIQIDKRTKILIKVYVLIFFVKSIIWLINFITVTSITRWL